MTSQVPSFLSKTALSSFAAVCLLSYCSSHIAGEESFEMRLQML